MFFGGVAGYYMGGKICKGSQVLASCMVRLMLGEREEVCSQMEYEVCPLELGNVVNASRLI
jgi:hypothetical protein